MLKFDFGGMEKSAPTVATMETGANGTHQQWKAGKPINCEKLNSDINLSFSRFEIGF